MRQTNPDWLSPEMARCDAVIMGLIEKHNLPFQRFETARSVERQEEVAGRGHSWVIEPKKAFHVVTEEFPKADAVDYVMNVDGKWLWGCDNDFVWNEEIHNMYRALAYLVRAKLGKNIVIGAIDWSRFDGAHYQLRKRTKQNAS